MLKQKWRAGEVRSETITAIARSAEAPGNHHERSPACARFESIHRLPAASPNVMLTYGGIQSLYQSVHANQDCSRYPRAASFFTSALHRSLQYQPCWPSDCFVYPLGLVDLYSEGDGECWSWKRRGVGGHPS